MANLKGCFFAPKVVEGAFCDGLFIAPDSEKTDRPFSLEKLFVWAKVELPKTDEGGGPAGVNDSAVLSRFGGGPAGVVEGCSSLLSRLESGVDGGSEEGKANMTERW